MPEARTVVVATHGHCLDGLCSAALFTRLLRHVEEVSGGAPLDFSYFAAGYGPGENGVPEERLSGDVNAILDYRFSTSERLTWYFDHHVSAFPTDADRRVFAERSAEPGEGRMFHDGAYGSCTKLIADVGARRFGLDSGPVAELVRWADMIDSASFPSAQMAVEKKEPVLKLMTVVESVGDAAFTARYVPELLERSIEDVARAPEIMELYAPIARAQERFVELVAHKAVLVGRSVLVDLTEGELDVAPKFVTYALYPTSAYSVVVTRSRKKCKLSIGYNPWSNIPRLHDIASICERHGGGGHPVVGAVSLPAVEVDRARELATDIARELGA